MRLVLSIVIVPLILSALCSPLLAQTVLNPVPFLNDPLVPGTAVPGGAGVTLTVTGAGFVSGSTVKWNGNVRQTTYVSTTQLTAAIPATDLLTAATIPVTVSNPAPGGGVSNPVLFEITTSTTSLAFTRIDTDFSYLGVSTIAAPVGFAVAYLSNSVTPFLSVADQRCPPSVGCLTEKAIIETTNGGAGYASFTVNTPDSVVAGDFNGDGIFDLIGLSPTLSYFQGNGDGTFQSQTTTALTAAGIYSSTPALGDFNRDGHLDMVLAAYYGAYFVPGNGDGTFGAPVFISTDPSSINTNVVTGDFNGDGILDLAVSNDDLLGGSVSILLGNGDGTFTLHTSIAFGFHPTQILAADFNGDGKLDLAVLEYSSTGTQIAVLLGNGDGTFLPKMEYAAGVSAGAFALGDFNADGSVDIAATDTLCTSAACPANGSVNVLIGNGDGTFQPHLDFSANGTPGAIASAEFSYFNSPAKMVGKEGFAVTNPNGNSVSIFAVAPNATVNPLPTITSVLPVLIIQGSGAFTLTVNGTNFVSGATVFFGGQPEQTTFVNSGQLTAQIPASAIANAGPVTVIVINPVPGGGNSTSTNINIYLAPPTISSITPSTVVAGSPGFTLTINGTNFVPESTLNLGSTSQSVTYVNINQVTASIAASAIVNQGTINVSVTDPIGGVNGTGGGTTSTLPLTVLSANSQPTIGQLSPASVTAGAAAFTLTLTGTGFSSQSTITFGSNAVTSAYQNPTTLTASIPASAVTVAGTSLVIVQNSSGKSSVAISFTVNNPVPTMMSLSPQTIAPGSSGQILTIAGSNFNLSSVVQVNGASRPTTLVSSTSLTTTLPASDFVNNGTSNITLNVTVSNPVPGGGITNPPLTITVPNFSVNTPASTASVMAGNPANYTLTVAPSNSGGTLASAVLFSATGLPAGASPTFSPSSLPAGSKSTSVSLSITTTPHTAVSAPLILRNRWLQPLFLYAIAFVMSLIWLGCSAARLPARRYVPQLLAVLLLGVVSALAACGGVVGNSNPQLNSATGTPAGSYPIIVTATSGSTSLTTNVILTVQ